MKFGHFDDVHREYVIDTPQASGFFWMGIDFAQSLLLGEIRPS